MVSETFHKKLNMQKIENNENESGTRAGIVESKVKKGEKGGSTRWQ
jgi:hypothetical protein